jgi:hypothetical protein
MRVGLELRSRAARSVPCLVAIGIALAPGSVPAAVPIAPGTWEFQAGIAGIVLPEDIPGTYSLQPEARIGYFIREGIELQAQGDVRVWPLGSVAPNHYGVGGSVLWFPPIQEERSLYLLGGMGGAYSDPPGSEEESSFDPLARAGFGFKVPISGLGPLDGSYLNLEYRGEMAFTDDPDFVSGAAIGLSFFRGDAVAQAQSTPPPPAATAPPATAPPAGTTPPKGAPPSTPPPPAPVDPPKEPPPPPIMPPDDIAPPDIPPPGGTAPEITPPEG